MEELIKQAFMHVDVIGPHVLEGHYDLIGPNGEIILPQVWETMIEPGWSISMHMWPMPEKTPTPAGPSPGHHFDPRERRPGSRHESRHHGRGGPPMPPPPNHRGGDPRGGMIPPVPPPGWPPNAPPPPPVGARGGGGGGGGMSEEPAIMIIPNGAGPSRPSGSSRRKTEPPKGVLNWMAGKPPKSSGKGIIITCMLQYSLT